jgi:hypothetical protein
MKRGCLIDFLKTVNEFHEKVLNQTIHCYWSWTFICYKFQVISISGPLNFKKEKMVLFKILLATAVFFPLLYGQNLILACLVLKKFEYNINHTWNLVFFTYVWLEFVFVLPLTLACVALKYRFGLLNNHLRWLSFLLNLQKSSLFDFQFNISA